MKWVFFALELLMLFAANNALFFVPRRYDLFTFVAVATAIILAALFAWLSSRKFGNGVRAQQLGWRSLLSAPPTVIWIFVIAVFCVLGLMRISANR